MPDEASGYVHSEAGEGEIDDNDKSLKSTPDSEGGGNCSSSMCQDILEATWGKDEETRIKSPTLMDQATCLTSNDLPTHTSILTSDDSDSSTSFRGFPEHCTEVSAINVECETQTRNERFIDADGEEFNSTSPSHFFHRTPEVEESQISISSSEKSKACNANNPLINTADKDNLQAQHLVQAKEITNNMKTLKESSAIQVECEMQTRNERFIDADGEEFNSTSLSHVFHKTAEVEENQSSISSSEKEFSAVNVECETQTRNERFIDADGEEFNSTSPSHFFHRTAEVEESQISISSSEKSKACNANNPLINTADKDNLQAQHLVQAKEITNNMKTLKEFSAIMDECEMQTRKEHFIDAAGEELKPTSPSHFFHKTAKVEESQNSTSSSGNVILFSPCWRELRCNHHICKRFDEYRIVQSPVKNVVLGVGSSNRPKVLQLRYKADSRLRPHRAATYALAPRVQTLTIPN
ncbi:uncharacterized protein [Procambarus clarkii]|uniref:uncharacterized protein isoform X2 n=1 Tax=Procambarus clarkii TaxID=6728 RepID=UPI0037420E90